MYCILYLSKEKPVKLSVVLLIAIISTSRFATSANLTQVITKTLPTKVIIDAELEAATAATVSAQVSAVVTKLHFDVNDKVEAGAILVELDDTELITQLDKSKAALSLYLAQLKQAQIELARLQALASEQFVSSNQITRATSNVEVAQANVNLAKAEMATTTKLLSYTKVVAPYSGVVTARHIEVGEMALIGMPLLSGFKQQQNRLVAHLPQRLVEKAEINGFILAQNSEGLWVELHGLTIAPHTHSNNHTVMVRVNVTPSQIDKRPGSFVKAAVLTQYQEALVIPQSAVFYQGDLATVFVKAGEQIVLRQVLIAQPEQGEVEVLSGLQSGDKVITHGAAYLSQLQLSARREN